MTDRYRAIGMYSGGLDSILAAKVIAEEDFPGIASICARYGKGSAEDTVTVIASKGSLSRELEVKPAVQKDIEPFFIG